MTTFERYEREIPRFMDELAPSSVPDYLDDMLRQTATMRQRPAWSALERWIPMGEIARPIPRFHIPWRPIAMVALLVAVLVAGLLVSAGSRSRVPAPFGPAANGSLIYGGGDGRIYRGDLETGASTSLVTSPSSLTIPVTSRDGRRMAYDQTAGDTTFFVADIDGSNVHPLAGSYRGVTSIAWSPDDTRIGVVSRLEGRPALTVLQADGSGATTLPLGRDVLKFVWLTDGRLAFIGGEAAGDPCLLDAPETVCALFVADADGSDVQMVLPADDFHGLAIDPSPDGRSLLYVRWDEAAEGMLWLVDLDSFEQRSVPFDNRDPAGQEAINNAWFSPDGRSILFDRFELNDEHWAVIPTAGGSAVNIGPAWPRGGPDGHGPEARWSPDGTSVIATYPNYQPADGSLRLLDPTTEGEGEALPFEAAYLPAWQRTAP